VSKRVYQRTTPLFMVSVFAGIVIATYFLPVEPLKSVTNELIQWGSILVGWTVFFSVVTSLIFLGRQVGKGFKYTYNSLLVFLILIVLLAVAFGYPGYGSGPLYTQIFNVVVGNTFTALQGVLTFNLIVGAYRAMKARSIEATVLMLAGLSWLAASVPVGPALLPVITPIGEFFTYQVNTAGARGPLIAASIGALVLVIRAIMTKEPSVIELEVT
jgi:predicted neutral ceramidase superfamily lipid hydrolase